MNLIILETLEDYDNYINSIDYEIENIIFTLNYLIIEKFKYKKIKFLNINDLIDFDNFKKDKSFFLKNIEDTVYDLDNYVSPKIQDKIPLGTFYKNKLIVLYTSIYFNYIIYKNIKKKFKNIKWIIYKPSKIFTENNFIMHGYYIFYKIIFNAYFNNEIKKLKIVNKKKIKNTDISFKYLVKIILGQNNINSIKLILTRLKIIFNFTNKIPLLIIGNYYNWKNITINQNFINYYKYYRIEDVHFNKNYNNDKNVQKILEKKLFFNGWKIIDLESQSKNISYFLATYKKKYKNYLLILKKIKYVLCSVITSPNSNLITYLANKKNIEVILMEHGEHFNNTNDIFFSSSELQFINHYVTFNKNLFKTLKKNYLNSGFLNKVTLVKQNDKYFQNYNFIKQNFKNKKKILYCAGKWFYHNNNLNDELVFQKDQYLYEAQKIILNYLYSVCKKYNLEIIFKASNNPNYNSFLFSNLISKNFVVERTIPFKNLIKDADVVILDTPATSLLESCMYQVPIFAYLKRHPLPKEVLKLAKKRIVSDYSAKLLIKKIDKYFESEIYNADLKNTELIDTIYYYDSKNDINKTIKKIFN